MNTPITYIYAYCRYDREKGDRLWNLLSQKQIKAIDEDIARTAFRTTDSAEEAERTIYFGSPNAQAITDHKQRCDYVSLVLMAITRTSAMSDEPCKFRQSGSFTSEWRAE